MKKITLAIFAVLSGVATVYGQATYTIQAPLNNNSTSAFRAPNGTSAHAFQRTVMFISASEMAPLKLGTINTFSFQYTHGTGSVPVPGNFTVYLANTSDVAYNKGSSFSAAISNMTMAYNGTYTVPAATGAATAGVVLTPTFAYNGGGLYVAWDWASTGPFSTGTATYLCNNQQGWAWTGDSPSAAPNTLAQSAFRPAILFGATNTATNEVEVFDVVAPGKVAKLFNSPMDVTSEVVNWGQNAVNNVSVTMNVTGANPFSVGQVIPTLAANTSTILTFSGFNPIVSGTNTITISTNYSDQLASNNSKSWTQSVTCNDYGMSPPTPTFNTSFGFGTSGNFALEYTPPTTASLQAIRAGIGSTTLNLGTQVSAVLMDASGTILDYSTTTLTIGGGHLGTMQLFNFNKPLVTGGTPYLFGFSQYAASYPMAIHKETVFPAPFVYYTTALGGGAPTVIGNAGGWLLIEPVFTFSQTLISAVASKTAVCAGEPVTLTASGAGTYTWSAGLGSSNPLTFTPQSTSGSTLVTVVGTQTAAPMAGCRSNTVLIQFNVSACTGVGLVENTSVKLFPNPTVSGKTTLAGLSGVTSITVFNALGQEVFSSTVSTDTAEIDLSNQASGNYVMKVTNDSKESRIIKLMN